MGDNRYRLSDLRASPTATEGLMNTLSKPDMPATLEEME